MAPDPSGATENSAQPTTSAPVGGDRHGHGGHERAAASETTTAAPAIPSAIQGSGAHLGRPAPARPVTSVAAVHGQRDGPGLHRRRPARRPGRLAAHPVDPVVVPGVGAPVGHGLPLGLGLVVGPGRQVDGALAVVVEVGGLGPGVALDRPVGPEPQVRLAAVPLDDHLVPLVDPQLEEGVAADDLGSHAVGRRARRR